MMKRYRSFKALLLAILVAILASNGAWGGGLKSALKEVGRAEKKLKDEGFLDKDKALTLSFKDGIHVHDQWEIDARAIYFGEIGLLMHADEFDDNYIGGANQASIAVKNTFSLKDYINFYSRKAFALEKMRASAECFDRKDREKTAEVELYVKNLKVLGMKSDVYSEQGEILENLKKSGVKRASVKAVDFNPIVDSQQFNSIWEKLKIQRHLVKINIKNDRYLIKCLRLFKN